MSNANDETKFVLFVKDETYEDVKSSLLKLGLASYIKEDIDVYLGPLTITCEILDLGNAVIAKKPPPVTFTEDNVQHRMRSRRL